MTDHEQTESSVLDRAPEVEAMGAVVKALATLNREAIGRVLRWAFDAYGVAPPSGGGKAQRNPAGADGGGSGGGDGTPAGDPVKFSSLADLYAATTPDSEPDKTLVGAYWIQYGESNADFGAQEVNTALKNLGHPIGNITSAFNALKARKPAPVMQLKKAGTTKQARKTYKLTNTGKAAVEAMIDEG